MADVKRYNNIDFQNIFTGKNVPDPTANQEIANKQYVDNTINSLILARDKKDAVKVATTSNITLSGGTPDTVDGISLAVGNRIGVVGQTNASQNGIYVVQTLGTGSNGTWIRSTDADSSSEVTQGMTFDVSQGNTYAGTTWLLVTPDPIVLNTTNLSFIQTNVGTVRKYTSTISSGTSSYTITHNLNSTNFTVEVVETVSGLRPEGILVTRSSSNAIVLDFGVNTSVDHDVTVMA